MHDADGHWTDLPMRALQMCERVGAEVVMKSGRRKSSVVAAARLLGQRSFIYEVGCALVVDGEEEFLTDGYLPRNGKNIFQLIEESGAPMLLLSHYAGLLEYHTPWHRNRDISHLMRGSVDAAEADELLAAQRPRQPAAGRQRRDRRARQPALRRPRARLPPDAARRIEGARGRPPHADPRLPARGVHRGRRLARGPRGRRGRSAASSWSPTPSRTTPRSRRRSAAARTSRSPRAATARASTRPSCGRSPRSARGPPVL